MVFAIGGEQLYNVLYNSGVKETVVLLLVDMEKK